MYKIRSKAVVPAILILTALVRHAAAWTAPVPDGMGVQLTAPRMSQPPTLDGRIDPEEWREATAVSGVGGCMDNIMIARPTTFFLAWDEKNIYLAMRVWVKPGYKPRNRGRQPGAASCFDDSGEFHFMPMGKNVPQGKTASSYKFNLNTLAFFGDFNRVSVGQQFKNWTPKFRAVAGMTKPGSAPLKVSAAPS